MENAVICPNPDCRKVIEIETRFIEVGKSYTCPRCNTVFEIEEIGEFHADVKPDER